VISAQRPGLLIAGWIEQTIGDQRKQRRRHGSTVDALTLAVKVAWKLRNSPRAEGLVYEDGSRARRAVD
jgi:hypothetical protein